MILKHRWLFFHCECFRCFLPKEYEIKVLSFNLCFSINYCFPPWLNTAYWLVFKCKIHIYFESLSQSSTGQPRSLSKAIFELKNSLYNLKDIYSNLWEISNILCSLVFCDDEIKNETTYSILIPHIRPSNLSSLGQKSYYF